MFRSGFNNRRQIDFRQFSARRCGFRLDDRRFGDLSAATGSTTCSAAADSIRTFCASWRGLRRGIVCTRSSCSLS
jgi:hypothetical protein